MPRYLVLYKLNSAIFPTDPKAALAAAEANFAGVEEMLKADILKETGATNAGEGYMICEFPSTEEALKMADSFFPGILTDVREIISLEKTKEIVLSRLREQAK